MLNDSFHPTIISDYGDSSNGINYTFVSSYPCMSSNCFIPTNSLNLSIGRLVHSITDTSVIKALLLDGSKVSFSLVCSFNGIRIKGKLRTLYVLIDSSTYFSLMYFYHIVSKCLDIPGLVPVSFPADEYNDKYIFSIRVPTDSYGNLWSTVQVKSLKLARNTRDWDIKDSFYIKVNVEGVHFSNAKDRSTPAHINFELSEVSDLDNIHNISEINQHIEAVVEELDTELSYTKEKRDNYKNKYKVTKKKLSELEQRVLELESLYKTSQTELSKSNIEIDKLVTECRGLRTGLISSNELVKELSISNGMLENSVTETQTENTKLMNILEEKNVIISSIGEWLESIIPYYKYYTNDVIRYRGFTSYTATSMNLNSLGKNDIKELVVSGACFQSLPFQRLYSRAFIEIIKSHTRTENIGLKDILSETKSLVEKLLTKYYNTGNLSTIEDYTKGNGW